MTCEETTSKHPILELKMRYIAYIWKIAKMVYIQNITSKYRIKDSLTQMSSNHKNISHKLM